MGRAPCCDKANVKRGPWSPEEDATLKCYVEAHGTGGNWITLPQKAGLRRCGKSCRLRWLNYLRPDIRHGGFTEEEDNIICTLYSQMGSRWSFIASQLAGRTDNDVKNYWNTKLKKKVLAEKKSKNINKENYPTNNIIPTQFGSTTPLPCVPKSETYNLDYYSASQSHISAALMPMLTDVCYGEVVNGSSTQSLMISSDTIQFSCSQLAAHHDLSEFGLKNIGQIVSSSQEGSSVSDSNSLAMENKSHMSLLTGGDVEDGGGILMDFGFGFPNYDHLISVPSFYSNLDEFVYAEIKPQGLNQSTVTNQY